VKQTLNNRLNVVANDMAGRKKDIANYRATLAYFESITPQVIPLLTTTTTIASFCEPETTLVVG
jgi:phosphopentomutase